MRGGSFLVTALVLGTVIRLGSCAQDVVKGTNEGHQRIYFEAWNVGEACGSNSVAGCREAAVDYLTSTAGVYRGYSPTEFQVMVALGLLGDDGQAFDLTQQNYLKGKNYTHFGGVCNGYHKDQIPSAVSVTLLSGYQILSKGAGCLVAEKDSAKESPKGFAVALIKPPPPNGVFGGQVKFCPDGFCLVALNAPSGAAITAGSDVVAKVCGEARHVCTVAVGDFNVSPEHSYEDRWAQLIGTPPTGPLGGAPKLYKEGQTHAQTLTQLEVGGAMNVGQGLPLRPPYNNVTGMQAALLIDLLLPCQHPGTFGSQGCTA